jgi:hypothetical protein
MYHQVLHQGQRPRVNPCPRHEHPGPSPGALDISRVFIILVPDQEPNAPGMGTLDPIQGP